MRAPSHLKQINYILMKTSKVRTGKQTKTNSEPMQPETGKQDSPGVYEPREEEIRNKAREIYLERIARKEHGTAVDDWLKAERLLKGSVK